MAEALGLTSSVIAVIQLTGLVASLSYGYIGAVRRAPQDLQRLVDELGPFGKALNTLRDVVERDPWSASLQQLLGDDGPLEKCRKQLSEMKAKLEHLSKDGFIRGVVGTLVWPLKESETSQYIARLERFKSLFTLALTADQS